MALDFPSSPALNQVYTFGSYSWRWDGTSWVGAVPIVNATINNTTIGVTTPSTGAFTSLTSTSGAFNGSVGATTPSSVAATSVTASSDILGTALLRLRGSTATDIQSYTGTAYTALGYDALSHRFQVSGVEKGLFSSTGLAVTGALSSTGNATVGQVTPTLTLGTQAGNYASIINLAGSNIDRNWRVSCNQYVASTFEITPSTAGGGTTFSTPAFVVNSSGNVGIGTTSPAYTLDVNGTARLGSGSPAILAGVGGAFVGGQGEFYTISTNSMGIGTTGAAALKLYTNSAERLRIDSSGNVGIGVTPSAKLDVVGGGVYAGDFYLNSQFRNPGYATTEKGILLGYSQATNASIIASGYAGGSGALAFWTHNGTSWGERARIDSSGRFLLGQTANGNGFIFQLAGSGGSAGDLSFDSTSTYCDIQSFNSKPLYLNRQGNSVIFSSLGTGLVYSNSGVLTSTNPSDSRLKTEITDLGYGLSSILALRPVSYKWKSDTINQGTQYGFIAQEVQAVMPELVKEFETKEDGETVTRLGLEKEGIYVAVVKAMQELNANLVAQVAALSQRLAALESK